MLEKKCFYSFFDQYLRAISLKEDFKTFYDRYMTVKDSQFWFYKEIHGHLCCAACYDCLFTILKFKVYRQKGSSTHVILNSVCRHILSSYS